MSPTGTRKRVLPRELLTCVGVYGFVLCCGLMLVLCWIVQSCVVVLVFGVDACSPRALSFPSNPTTPVENLPPPPYLPSHSVPAVHRPVQRRGPAKRVGLLLQQEQVEQGAQDAGPEDGAVLDADCVFCCCVCVEG